MAKTFTTITENGPLVVSGGKKTTIVNASYSNLYLTDNDTDAALDDLPYEAKIAVLNSLFSLAPGASKSLATGTYNLSFAMPFGVMAVVVVDGPAQSTQPDQQTA